MKPYQPAWYKSPIDLPEKTIGRCSIKHRVVTGKTPVIGTRQAFTRGISTLNAKLNEPLLIHELHEKDHGLWMTDLPEELNQIEEMLYNVKPQGRVLVGGLGLGIVAKRLTEIPGITNVTVVEKSKAVINLVLPQTRKSVAEAALRVNIWCEDIACYLADSTTPRFDFYLLDTWGGTNESTWWNTVMPLRRAIRNRWGNKPVIHNWAEDIMLEQVKQSLVIDDMKKEMLRLHNADIGKKKLTLQDCRTWFYKYFPVDMTPAQADWFLAHVGETSWEKKYGVMIDKVTKGDRK